MLLNWAEIQGREGEVVRVEVCLQGASGGICRDCGDICCCIIDVGTLCCQEGDQTCIFFPYVVTQIYPWWTGVAITNYGGNASLDLTLTLVDQNGNAFVWQKTTTPRPCGRSSLTRSWGTSSARERRQQARPC